MRDPKKLAALKVKERQRQLRRTTTVVPLLSTMRRAFHIHESKTGKVSWQFRLVSVCIAPTYWAGSSRGSTLWMSVKKLAGGRGFSLKNNPRSTTLVGTYPTFEEARAEAVRLLTATHDMSQRLDGRDITWFWFQCAGECPRCPPEVRERIGTLMEHSWKGVWKTSHFVRGR